MNFFVQVKWDWNGWCCWFIGLSVIWYDDADDADDDADDDDAADDDY